MITAVMVLICLIGRRKLGAAASGFWQAVRTVPNQRLLIAAGVVFAVAALVSDRAGQIAPYLGLAMLAAAVAIESWPSSP